MISGSCFTTADVLGFTLLGAQCESCLEKLFPPVNWCSGGTARARRGWAASCSSGCAQAWEETAISAPQRPRSV